MGDIRFRTPYERLRAASDRMAVLRSLDDEGVVAALAASAAEADRYLANILATEAQNRMLQAGRALEHIDEGVLMLDADDRVLRANSKVVTMLGTEVSEIMGTPVSAWFLRPAEADAIIAATETSAEPVERSGVMLLARDRTLVTMVTGSRVTRDGARVGTVFAIVDLTARLDSDRRRGLGAVVTRILSDPVVLGDAAPRVLAAIGKRLGWSAGALWIVEEGEGARLRCTHYWAATPRALGFESVTRDLRVEPGHTLPGRVWASGRPIWYEDLRKEGSFVRAEGAAQAGLCCAFAVPVRATGRTIGVFEFFHTEILPLDDELLKTMEVVAGLLGQFVERSRLAGQNALLVALLDAMEDAMIIVEPSGRIATANAAAARLLARPRAALAGTRLDRQLSFAGGTTSVEALAGVLAGEERGFAEATPAADEGADIALDVLARPIRNDEDVVVGAMLQLRPRAPRASAATIP